MLFYIVARIAHFKSLYTILVIGQGDDSVVGVIVQYVLNAIATRFGHMNEESVVS